MSSIVFAGRSDLKFNEKSVRRVPINRNSLFYDKESYNFELEMGKNYIEQDMGQTIVLYQVIAQETQSDAVYGETDAGAVQYKTPIEVPCVYQVDEPELSMHPRWQAKILPFYEGLFKDAAGSQLAQMFFATHSNYVVDSSFAEPAEHLVLLLDVDEHGAVSYHKVDDADRVLPRVSPAEINYLAFRLPSIEYHVELYGYLQIKAGLATVGRAMNVKETDNYIKNQPQYNAAQHFKRYTFHDVSHNKVVNYDTLCTYIRNCIDHPDHNVNPAPSQNEMECSIELLRELCR